MQRRQFLTHSTAAGILTAATSALAQSPAKLRVGMLGTGHSHFGGKLKALLDNPSYEVVGIAESNPELRNKPQKVPFISEEQLLHDPTIPLVVVECRVWEALPFGTKVVAAGKHLHLEKPPGNSYSAFRELVEEARRRKLLLQTGYLFRGHQGMVAAIEAAKKGWLGDVFLIRAAINSDRGPEERATEGRYKGGGMFELAGHFIDPVVELLGRPTAVRAYLRHDTSEPDKLADNNLAVFEYNKALAVITQATKVFASGPQRSFEILGSQGTVLLYPEANPPVLHISLRKAQGPYRAGNQTISLPPQPRFVPDFAELARAIQSGVPLRHSYDHELLLHETLLRASGEIA